VSKTNASEPTGPHYSTLPVDSEARLPAGVVVGDGRFEIVEQIGRGGMAIVYRARDHHAGDEIAFKVVTAQADRANTEARYHNEARLGASLARHPHVVRPIAVGRLDGPVGFEGRMYLATELVAGVSLDDLMVQHRTGLERQRACAIALDVARALVGLHERGIVHRDIKPGNVVVTTEGRARLLDFGLAYATGDGWEQKSPDLTEEGHAPGTPLYMSPEQAAHTRPSPAFDIYSFGVMLYELLSGNPPLDSMPLGALLGLKCDPSWQPFPIAKMCPDVPTHITDLVDRCLAYDPRERPSAQELVAALENTPSVVPVMEPQLRLVPRERALVIADGAREAGDETRADIVRKAIPLPSVKAALQAASASAATQPVLRGPVASEPPPALNPVERDTSVERATPVARATTEPSPSPETATRVGPGPEQELTPTPFPTGAQWKIPLVFLGLALLAAVIVYVVQAGPREPERSMNAQPVERTPAAGSANPEEPVSAARPDVGVQPSAAADPPRMSDSEPDPRASTADARASDPPRKRPAIEPARTKPISCEDRRKQASDAAAKKKWPTVLNVTTDASCWSDAKSQRARLRVEALLRLGRFKACAKEAFRSSDPTVAQLGEECFRRAENPADPDGGAQ
jgi:serine/threonine protein kinase